jgi:purine catabolism regulator
LDIEDVVGESIKQVNDTAKLKLNIVLEFLNREFDKCDIHIGLGSFHQGIKGLQTSYHEAKQAIKIGFQLCRHH